MHILIGNEEIAVSGGAEVVFPFGLIAAARSPKIQIGFPENSTVRSDKKIVEYKNTFYGMLKLTAQIFQIRKETK